MLKQILERSREHHSLVLGMLQAFFAGIIRLTMFAPFSRLGVDRDGLRIRHLEIYLFCTTLTIVGLIVISQYWLVAGWLLVILGSLRILQIISLNAMSLLFGLRLLSASVAEKERARWHFVAILFSVFDVLAVYGFLYHFFNRVYGILNIPPDSLFDHFYYAMITLMTVGYGDIVPIHPLGKFLAMSEAFMGVFLFVFLVNAAMGRLLRHSE